MLIILVVWIVYPPLFQIEIWKSILGLILVILNLLWVCHVLAFLGARYRDIEPLVSTIMPLIFFFTPVIYRSQNFDGLSNLIFLNPLSYAVDSIREPLLGHAIGYQPYLIGAFTAIIGLFLAVIVTGSSRHKLAYWL
jgi:ABC-type polysaccharide/polyol phosphate export permease